MPHSQNKQPKQMDPKQIENLIKQQINCHIIQVQSPDNTHYSALIVSDDFKQQSQIKRHRMVYQTLGQLMAAEIHALSLETLTIDEHQQRTQV